MKNISTKANVLKNLKINSAKIPYLISFSEREFLNVKEKILERITKIFKKKVAIRSSNVAEDQEKKSFAGYFKSFLNINATEKTLLKNT